MIENCHYHLIHHFNQQQLLFLGSEAGFFLVWMGSSQVSGLPLCPAKEPCWPVKENNIEVVPAVGASRTSYSDTAILPAQGATGK